ncbi:unnamed protein product [Caenorhabditis bovis]|uniref:Doublecortin domain-containing protein n=1 Tax=Caenorhabditis bovis TaxID=2654633 RepID=A0A8S1F8K9_9PELO|nr:unnamed protein product [Caenorhabditis bovis]
MLGYSWLFLPALTGAILPPFFLGKPPGGHARNYMLERHLHKINKLNDEYPYLQTHNFTQKLDHFDSNNNKTWQQKYYYNPIYSRNHSIVFLMIGGEGPESGKWAAYQDVQYLQWANELGADVFDLEHRFFGDSWPIPNMEVSSLRYLTTQQALADIAEFIKAMNKKHGFTNPRWVTFGGSYPGSLSAWFRKMYPDLTKGAVASSAPVNLKLDFYEYAMVVEDDLKVTDPNCADAVRNAFQQMQQLSITIEGRKTLSTTFNLVPKFNANTTKLDITNFFGNIYNAFQGMTQYTYDGTNEKTQVNTTVRKMCDIMTDSSEPNLVNRVRNLFRWYNFFDPMGPDLSVMPNNYWDVIAQVGSGDLNVLGVAGAAARGWMWLCCNEIGFLQTTDQGRNVFGSTVPLNYFVDMCTDMFDSTIDMRYIYTNNKRAQKYYGGADHYSGGTSAASNVVLPNGSLDPWHALGTYVKNDDRSVIPLFINGTAHCADMYPSYKGEPPALVSARAVIKENVMKFIKYDPNVDGKGDYYGDEYPGISYVELNKRRRGEGLRREGEKLINRMNRPKVKKIYVKRNGEATHIKPKLFVWRQWQSPTLKQLLEDVGPYVGLDDGAEGIYTLDGDPITDPDDIEDLSTYFITGEEDLVIHSENFGRRQSDSDIAIKDNISGWNKEQPTHTSLSAPEYYTSNSVRSTYPSNISYPPTPPPRPYTGDGYGRTPRRTKYQSNSLKQYDDYFNEAINIDNRGASQVPRKTNTFIDDFNEFPQASDFDNFDTIRKDREQLEKHKQKMAQMGRRRSAMIFNRRDQTHPDAYLIYVFLNGQGMESQYMNFQRKQLEKGMNYVLELIARRYNVNPSKLVDMDGRKISEVSQLMSRGAYVLIPAGQHFRDTWYFLPDNAIDTSSNKAMVEERSAQRDRLLQRRLKKEKKAKLASRKSRSKSEAPPAKVEFNGRKSVAQSVPARRDALRYYS